MFKNRIRERRKELGLSQSQLARLVGMAASTLSNIELGKWKPYPKARTDLSRTLGKTIEELFDNNSGD